MKKLRESLIAKMAAWIICTAAALGSAVLGLCILLGISDDMFHKTRDDMLKRAYENANMEYSEQVVYNMGSRDLGQALRDNCFKYGIIKSDSLKGVNFHDRLSYLETNMTEEELKNMDVDKLFLYQLVHNEQNSMGTWQGYYGSYEDISALDVSGSNLIDEFSTEWTSLYADRICYDVTKGILYYRAEGNYYPVQNVSLRYNGSEGQTIYDYSYDFGSKAYRLNYKSSGEGTVWTDEIAEIPEEAEVLQTDRIQVQNETDNAGTGNAASGQIERVLDGDKDADGIVNFAELNNTEFSYKNWGTILLDNIRMIDSKELTLIDSRTYSDKYFINEPGYYLNENYSLVVSEELQTDNYWVVSIVPDTVPVNLTDNKYVQQGWLVNAYYDIIDRNVYQGLGISILVMLLSFGFLVYAAGHRRGAESITLSYFDRIPVDILSVCIFVLMCVLILWTEYVIRETAIRTSVYTCIWALCILGIAMIVTGIRYVLSLCVRIKAGKWWRNSLCYRIYSSICHVVRTIFKNIDLLWKGIIIFAGVSFLEFCVLASFDRDSMVVLWLLEKAVIGIGMFMIIIQMHELQKASRHMAEGNLSYKVAAEKMFWECRKHGENLNKIGEGMSKAVDERMKSERFKTELITNVSHDIKTPLTSIINYVDLLGKEELHNEKAAEYLEVLDRQSSKLKKLIEDLVEASKASSGNLPVDSQRMEAGVFVTQTVGEFEEKLSLAGLQLIVNKIEEPVYIMADGRHLWRVIDNLMNNICKYAQSGSRVYVNLEAEEKNVSITFRNISKYPLNISGEELMERFVRGDKSRNTEGHGLGLSIAQSLINLIGGDMNIVVDGDLFKVVLTFERYHPDTREFVTMEKEQEDKELVQEIKQ